MPDERVRLAEPVAAMSLVCDLGMGQPLGHGARVCLLAMGLAREVGLGPAVLRTVYYAALLRWIGCSANAHEVAGALGDDLEPRTDMATLDHRSPGAVTRFLHLHGGGPAASLLADPATWRDIAAAHCESAVLLGRWLGLEPDVQDALDQVFERWDGHGLPRGLAGEEIGIAARVVRVAGDAELFHRAGGPEAVLAAARARAGTVYDPWLAAAVADAAPGLFARLGTGGAWDAVLDAEPGPRVQAEGERLERVLEALADFADLKAPCFTGRSRAVAALAGRAAGLRGLDASTVRRAALLQDVGRVGVSASVWDRPGPLDDGEREAVRLHPYLTERALSRSAWLAPVADLAAAHHERLDGSGYHRRLDARTLAPAARVLAAADVYQAMTEPRPHRRALTPREVLAELRGETRRGALDPGAVDAVLAAAGHGGGSPPGPLGLTVRELEVLALLARGLRNREIAERLVVSPKTVGHHVEHVYGKLGVSTRAAATLRAMQEGLLADQR